MSKTEISNTTVEWRELNWRKIHKAVWKLQKRIFRAYVNGDVKKGRKLQKTLIKSYYNRLLSVRKVSQDNQGKKRMGPRVAERTGLINPAGNPQEQPLRKGRRTKQTAGVDRIKSLTPPQRLKMAQNLQLSNKSKPIRRHSA